MSTSDDVQKRNAFAACAEFRIEGLEASLHHAREIAVREELGVVERKVFVFRDRPRRRDDVLAFYGDGAAVSALTFSSTIKDMKALLHNG